MAVINKNLPPQIDNSLGTVTLDSKKNDAMIQKHGVRIQYYTTLWCPNIKRIDSLEHELNCPLCKGQNLIDVNPKDSWAFIQSQTLLKNFNMDGTWDDQQVAATFMSGVELNYFAKVILSDYTSTYFEHLQRSEGLIDVPKYPIFSVNYLIDKHGKTYTPEIDFIIDGNGNLNWLINSKTPEPGTLYSIHYNYHVTFRAVNAMHVMRFGAAHIKGQGRQAVEYQQQWTLKRDYLITREDLESNKVFTSSHVTGFPTNV